MYTQFSIRVRTLPWRPRKFPWYISVLWRRSSVMTFRLLPRRVSANGSGEVTGDPIGHQLRLLPARNSRPIKSVQNSRRVASDIEKPVYIRRRQQQLAGAIVAVGL